MAKRPKKKTRKMKEAESKRMPKWLIRELIAMGERDANLLQNRLKEKYGR